MDIFHFDSNVWMTIKGDQVMQNFVNKLISLKVIEIKKTHIQQDETGQILEGTLIPTRGALWDISKWDQATLGTNDDHQSIKVIALKTKKSNRPDYQDGLIA